MNSAASVVLSVQDVKKIMDRKLIINNVSFDVHAGEVFGFLGPNGAGKTTMIRMLVDLIKPTEGRIQVCGFDVNRHPEKALRHVGAIVETPEMYHFLTGWENLQYFGRMMPNMVTNRLHEVVHIVGLTARIHDKVQMYSLGMRQRLGIAQALLGRPKLLILDEPTNGLDPLGIKEFRAFIRTLADSGMAVFVSSHLLSEIQLLCDRVAIISHGKVLAVDDVRQLLMRRNPFVIWQVKPEGRARQVLAESGAVTFFDRGNGLIDEEVFAGIPNYAILTETVVERIAGLNRTLVEAGVEVEGIQRIFPSLEQLFLKITEGECIE